MAQGSGFFKGEKKKQKKTKSKGFFANTTGGAPTYSMPEVISKKKKNA